MSSSSPHHTTALPTAQDWQYLLKRDFSTAMGYKFAVHITTLVLFSSVWNLHTATACHNSSDHELSSRDPCTRCTCPPKSTEQLAEQFNAISYSISDCVSLSRVDVPIDGFTMTPVYFITTDDSCIRSHYPSQCFRPTSPSRCSWSREWVDLGADYFPRFVSDVQCRGSCMSNGRYIFNGYVLRRQDYCDEKGEVWRAVTSPQRIHVACDCPN